MPWAEQAAYLCLTARSPGPNTNEYARMRTTTTLAFAALLLAPAAQAQLLNIYLPDEGPLVNGSTVVKYGQPSEGIVSQQLPVVLNASASTEVGVKRYELEAPAGTQNYFCWYDCWIPAAAGTHPLWYAIDPYVLQPGIQFNGFYADVMPQGITGNSSFLFVWYDVADTTDSVWVRIDFEIAEGAGLPERTDVVSAFSAHPNPSLDGAMNMDISLATWTGHEELVLRDATGRMALRRALPQGTRRVDLRAGELTPGVWIATLLSEGEVLASRRVVVAGH